MFALILTTLLASEPEVAEKPDVQALCLMAVNEKRARHGLYPYVKDERLQKIAERRAREMARSHRFGHYNVVCAEGIGLVSGRATNKQFRSCYLYSTGYRKAGAAMYFSGRSTYYCLTVGR